MPEVSSSIEINGSLDEVFALAKQIESFPEFMPDVKNVTILERSECGTKIISQWVGIVKEFNTTINWTEEDIWDDHNKTCTFTLVKGDYATYFGKWTFSEQGGKTIFESAITVEYDVPLIGALIKGIIAKKMKENVDNMLAAIKNKIENN